MLCGYGATIGNANMEIRSYRVGDLPGVLRLCEIEDWPSLPENPDRANRALTAPGVTTLVACSNDRIVAFAQALSDALHLDF